MKKNSIVMFLGYGKVIVGKREEIEIISEFIHQSMLRMSITEDKNNWLQ